MADGGNPQKSLPKARSDMADLTVGSKDPRGRVVRDLLWNVEEFKIYKTDAGISPFFSDDAELAKSQKLNYLAMGSGIAEFNNLIQTMQPLSIPFTRIELPTTPANARATAHYERELARCIAQALIGQVEEANASLALLKGQLAAKVANRGRVFHLIVSLILTAIAIFGGITVAVLHTDSLFGYHIKEMSIAVMMGSLGALFSTSVRLRSMVVDPTVGVTMHVVYGGQRILVGVLAAMIIYFGFRSGIISGLFQPIGAEVGPAVSGGTQVAQAFNIYWLSFVCVLAGFSEQLVPNLLDSQADAATGTNGDADKDKVDPVDPG